MTGVAVDCETWTGLAADPRRRGKRRRVTLWRHPQAWPGEHCSGVMLGGTRCSRLPAGQRANTGEPPVWLVSTGGYWCDHDLPPRYRALVRGEAVTRRWEPPAPRPVRQQDRAQPQQPSVDGQGGLW